MAAGRDIDGLRDLSYAALGMAKELAGLHDMPGLVWSCTCLLFSWVRRVWSIWEGGSTRPSSMSTSVGPECVTTRDGRLWSASCVSPPRLMQNRVDPYTKMRNHCVCYGAACLLENLDDVYQL